MFQQPFQSAVDNYIAARIDEKTFLKRTEYFSRWGFDYRLYREILRYAREFRIPVIALNIRKEIVSKVAKDGLLSLSDEERKALPEYLDFTDAEYRDRLREVFSQHSRPDDRSFDFFFQAQVLWDESMAANLDAFLRKNPDHTVIVLAGGGHLAFGSGIPKRAQRLNGRPYVVLLNEEELQESIADYILYPQPVAAPEAPKLMVMLKEDQGRVLVSAFMPESVSEQAGVREDDVIIEVDGEKIGAIDDIKIALLDRKKGDLLHVRVMRKRFLFGEQAYDFDVRL